MHPLSLQCSRPPRRSGGSCQTRPARLRDVPTRVSHFTNAPPRGPLGSPPSPKLHPEGATFKPPAMVVCQHSVVQRLAVFGSTFQGDLLHKPTVVRDRCSNPSRGRPIPASVHSGPPTTAHDLVCASPLSVLLRGWIIGSLLGYKLLTGLGLPSAKARRGLTLAKKLGKPHDLRHEGRPCLMW